MKNYLDLLERVVETGEDREDRTGTGTRSLFGESLSFDLRDGFPLVTTKKVFFKGIVHELLWMLSGSTNVKYLQENGVHIWDAWADENGDLGPVYGYQWRNFNSQNIDQLEKTVELVKSDPCSRRIVVFTSNPAQEDQMKLPPCLCLFQLYVSSEFVDMNVYQRSCDLFLGGPFDIAQYALLLSMVCRVVGKKPRKLNFFYGDAHVYKNHFEQVRTQLGRTPLLLPTLELRSLNSLFDYQEGDIELRGYQFHPAIKGEVSV